MRVLIVHNEYRQRGGEDSVVEAESELLRSRGHEVRLFTRHNEEIKGRSRLAVAGQALWSRPSARASVDLLAEFAPTVIHVHNTFPLISPSIYWMAGRARTPVVQTLHNFRLLCPQAMLLRAGRVCEDCVGHIPWRGAVRGCYRGSRAESAVLAAMLSVHRIAGTYQHKVTRYIALNEFCRRKFIEGGLPADRIVVKPNFVDCPPPPVGSRDGFLFVGRLSAEKGIATLVHASQRVPGQTIRVAGDGPEAVTLRAAPGVQPLGALASEAVRREMARATALILPSIWYENMPMVLVEAFASGLPVIASRIGALADLVEEGVTGLLFEPGGAEDLAGKIRWAASNPQSMAAMGRRARAMYESAYTADRNYEQLMAIYRDAIRTADAARRRFAPRSPDWRGEDGRLAGP